MTVKKAEFHRNHVGFIFQAFHLIDEMKVYENIETPLGYKDIKLSKRKAVVADMFDRFNMVAKKIVFQTAFGQTAAIGRNSSRIVGKPKLLQTDVPTGNLHSVRVSRLWNFCNCSTKKTSQLFR